MEDNNQPNKNSVFKGEDFTGIPVVDLNNKTVLSFKGGGGKGNAYSGVIKVLEHEDYGRLLPLNSSNPNKQIVGIGGASAGAITSLAISLGMSVEDINNISKKETSKFLFDGGFEFADFMAKDEANPGSYRAVEITQDADGFKAKIGFTYDTIYKDDYFDREAKKKIRRRNGVKDKQEQVAEDAKEFLLTQNESGYEEYDTKVKRKRLKKIAALKVHVAGGGFTESPESDPKLKKLNEESLYNDEGIFFGGKVRGAIFRYLKMRIDKDDPILSAMKNKVGFHAYLYNILYDRGMFCGTYNRKYFIRMIDYYLNLYHNEKYAPIAAHYEKEKGKGQGGTLTFEEYYFVTGIDLRIGGTNLTAGENVIFSRVHTPYFPVCEAVGLSMNIPGVFKPVYIKSKDENGNELKNTNLKSGLYVDSGLTNNMPMSTFLQDSPHQTGKTIHPKNIFGFRVFDGPNPRIFNPEMPYIWDDGTNYEESFRVFYSKYLLDYLKENNELPPRLTPITYYDIPAAPRGILGTTLLKMLSYSLDTFLNASTLNDLTPELNKNIVDVFSYNITTMDFTPDQNLLDFVTGQAMIRAKNLMKYTANKNE